MAKQTKKQQPLSPDGRLELYKRQQWFDLAYKLPATLIKWGTFAWLGYQASLAMMVMAGESTHVDLLFRFFGEGRLACGLSALFGIGGVGYGLLERREKRRKVKYLASRNADLESRQDPGRTSSELMPDGQTNEDDVA